MLAIWAFWGFNLLMVAWIWGGMSASSQRSASLSGAELAGNQIGTGIGFVMLVVIWVFGAIIFGLMALLTRPR